METAQALWSGIERRLGFVPPFFDPARDNPDVLEHLWRQTVTAYLDNPLPPLFKERLFAYLSRYCSVPYCIVCHSCALRPLGMQPAEILTMLEAPVPTEEDVTRELASLLAAGAPLPRWPDPGSHEEALLFSAAVQLFLARSANRIRPLLRQILPPAEFDRLLVFLEYVQSCHAWVEAHPELAYEADQRTQTHLPELLQGVPEMAEFFAGYAARIQRERRTREERLLGDLADRRRVEEELRREIVLRTAIEDSMLAGVAVVDGRGVQTYVNPAFCNMVGWSRDELVGAAPPFVYWPPEELDHIQEAFRSTLEGRVPPEGFELRFQRRDGQRFHALVMLSPLQHGDGGWLASVYDITERKRVEDQLRLYREIFANASDGIALIDPAGRYLEQNAAHQQLAGYPDAELQGQTPAIHLGEGTFREIARELTAGKPYRGEVKSRTRDGRLLDLDLSAFAVRNAAGEPFVYVGIKRDITARKRADEVQRFLSQASAILASSLGYQMTLQSVAKLAVPALADWCIIDLIDEDRSIRRIQVAAADPEQERLLEELQQLHPPDWDSPHPAARVLRTGQSEFLPEVDARVVAAHTRNAEHARLITELGVRSHIAVPLHARGQLLGTISLAMTDSGRRYTRSDLELAEELARRAALAIDNARLYLAAQRANQAKSQFLAVMSHELRTPLNAIIGYQEILHNEIVGTLNPVQKQQLGRVRESAWHLLYLIDQVLNLAQIEAGRVELRLEEVDFAQLVRDTAALMEPQAQKKGLRLQVQTPRAPVWGRTDLGKLRQILLNLLSNAVKFTDAGGVDVSLEQGADGTLRFGVRDTGLGIAPEHWKTIFQPFTQVDQSATRERGGTGLGLTVSRQLAQQLGGDLKVESAPGQGSTFTLRLPTTPERELLAGEGPAIPTD